LIQFQTYRPEDFVRIVNLSLDAIISTFAKGTAPKALALSAADFLKSLAVTVKPTNLASTPQICTLIQNVSTIQSQPTEVQSFLYVSLAHALLTSVPLQQAQFAQLMGSLTSKLLATQTPDFLQVAAQEHVVNTIDQTLQILSAITSSLNNETKQTKQRKWTSHLLPPQQNFLGAHSLVSLLSCFWRYRVYTFPCIISFHYLFA
jgi:hypothetical protein